MSVGKAPACVPTWRGHIETTKDALIIFEACFTGTLAHCFRRPHDRERNQLIVSGNVFVYEEATSGIKRWTDGIPWSPSRILTNFLIYRQLNSPFPPGEKKRATKRSQRSLKPGDPYLGSANSTPAADEGRSFFGPESPNQSNNKMDDNLDKDANRGLVGSLVDSYEFKENGLLKKTMTVTVHNVQHHLVSYYSLDDAKYNLKTPREDPRLKDIPIREALLNQPKFKFPNLDDAGDGTYEQMEGSPNAYPQYFPNGYDPTRIYAGPNSALPPPQVSSPGYHTGAYAPSHSPATYASMAPTTSSYAPSAVVQFSQSQPHNPYPHHFKQEQVSQYQSHLQHPHFHSQQFPVRPQDQQVQHLNFPQQASAHALPRPPGMLGYFTEGQGQGDATMNHDPYGSPTMKSEGMMSSGSISRPTQSWAPFPYTQQWGPRPERQQYSSYPAQS